MKRSVAFLATMVIAVSMFAAGGGFHLLKTVLFPATTGGIIASLTRWGGGCMSRIYSHVVVMDIDSDTLVGKIDGTAAFTESPWPAIWTGVLPVMAVLDSNNGHVIATLPVGQGRDSAAFDTEARLAFSSNGDGTVTVIKAESPNAYSVIENVKTAVGARTMAVDSKIPRIFLPVAEHGPAPPATAENPRSRAPQLPGTFRILIFGK